MSDPTRTSQSTRHATGPAGAAARTPAAAVAPALRRPLAGAFRLLLAAVALTGLLLEALATPAPARLAASFTAQAALATALVSVCTAHRAWTGRRPVTPRLTGALLTYVSLTALLHHLPTGAPAPFALPEAAAPTTAQAISHLLLFTLTPLATAADWLLLTSPRGFRLPFAWQWPAYPLLYLGFTLPLPAPAGTAPSRALAPTLTIAVASCLLPLAALAIDQVRPTPRLRKNRISPTGISPLK
ncbi:integral membrane regulator [Streptomyces sp. NPDC059008]|uniref:integral membrane regulator n=1 Tax=Streptomyces sp. NPDC059008 TaxID=3346693 RepID=UPI0036884E0F